MYRTHMAEPLTKMFHFLNSQTGIFFFKVIFGDSEVDVVHRQNWS